MPRERRKPGALTVGFALEAGGGLDRARQKLREKSLDLIVFNDALVPGAGFEGDTNRVTVLFPDGNERDLPLQSKRDVAGVLFDLIEERLDR
jgi:phosphopantothenoylcysteine decarboxylase/phosphopantothenate--cysteine ligase